MKRIALALFLAGCMVPLAKAQDQFQAGAYVDYFRISQTKTNEAGLGGRAAFKAFPHVMVEGEMSYDFEQACLEDGQAGNGGIDFGLGGGFPEDGGSGDVDALPYLAEDAGGVEYFDAGGFLGDQFGGEGGGIVEDAAADG